MVKIKMQTTSNKQSINRERLDWRSIVERVSEELQWFEEQGIKPTLRTLFYRLVSLEIIPNTQQTYKQLSSNTVDAKKDGLLQWDCFADEGRQVLEDFDDRYLTPEEYIQDGIDWLKNAAENYSVPRWYNQPHYVEVWIEKQALADTFASFLKDRNVRIAVNRGYSSWTFLYQNCMRLLRAKRVGKQVHILYFGDFDPSGDDMEGHLNNAFSYFNTWKILIVRE
jgi:hypothetical protein